GRLPPPVGAAGRASPSARNSGDSIKDYGHVAGLWDQDRLQALPDPERAAPSERGPAILAPAPSVILECDTRGSTHPARSGCGLLDAAPPTLVGDLGCEPLRAFEEISRVAVLPGGDRGLRRVMEILRLPHVRSDVPRKANVVGDESDRFLDLADPAGPRVLHSLGGLDETLPRRGKPIPVEEVAPSLPCVFGQGDRCTEVRGLANRIPREGEQIAHPVRL